MWSSKSLFDAALDGEMAEAPSGIPWIVGGRPTGAYPAGQDESWWRDHGPDMVQRWMDWRKNTPWSIWIAPDGQPCIELILEVELGAGGPAKMILDCGFATERENDRLILVDVKTGSAPQYGFLQLGLQKVGVELAYPGVKVYGAAYWNARSGDLGPIAGLSWATPEYYAALARRKRQAEMVGAFLPNVGPLCRTCGVGRFCAANNGAEAHLDPDNVLMRPEG